MKFSTITAECYLEDKAVVSLHAQTCIDNLYDKIFNDPAIHGQNLELIQQTVHDDWEISPKWKKINSEGPQCLKKMMEHANAMFHDFYLLRKQTLSRR